MSESVPEGGGPRPVEAIKPTEVINPPEIKTSAPLETTPLPQGLPRVFREIHPDEALQIISGIHPEQMERNKKTDPEQKDKPLHTQPNSAEALIPTPTIQEREQSAREAGLHPENPQPRKIEEIFTRTGNLVNPELEPVNLLPGVDTTKWPQELQEILTLAETIRPDSRERARLTIQYITALPVEGWKHADLHTKLKEAYKYYVQGTYGFKDLERESPKAAERLIKAQEDIIDLHLIRTTKPLTAAENARFNKLSAELTSLRGQLSEVQREATDMDMIGGMLARRLEERDKRLVEQEQRNEALSKARESEALKKFLNIQAEEQRKKEEAEERGETYEVRTHAKILEDLKEYIDEKTGEPIEAIKRYRTLTIQLEAAREFEAADPTFTPRREAIERKLNKVRAVGEIWEGLNQERETYLLAARALGVTKGVEARVAGYYSRNRGNIIEGDLSGFHDFVEDIETRPREREYLDRLIAQKDLEAKFGRRQALGIDENVVNDMLVGTISDYTQDALVELTAQAHRFAGAAATDQPLLQLIAADNRFNPRAGRFDSAQIEQSLRVRAASERRRHLIERRTYEEPPQNIRDEDLYKFDRNDYNYLMIFATSESELREALTDIILYRASPDAPFDVNELLQDITRVDNLLEGFKRRFNIKDKPYERMKFEFDGTLKSIGGAHFAYIGDEKTEAKIGSAWTQTYAAKRRRFVWEGGQEPGINAFILDDKENNPINKIIEQLDGLEGELHNDHPTQRQLWREWIGFEAHRALGALLHAPELNQQKLGLDIPRSEFKAFYWEDIYKEGKFDLDKINEKLATGEALTKDERWTCELLAIASRQDWGEIGNKVKPEEFDRITALLEKHADLIEVFVESIKVEELLDIIDRKRKPADPKNREKLTPEEQFRYDFACRYFGRKFINDESTTPDSAAENLHVDEWKILDYLVALDGAPLYDQRLRERKVTEDTKDKYEKIYWISRIQQLMSTGRSDQVRGDLERAYRWFYKPAHDRMVAQVGLALNFETFMGEAAERSSSTFVADNGDYLPDDGIYDFMHVIRFTAEQAILDGTDYHTAKERTAGLQGRRNIFPTGMSKADRTSRVEELVSLREDYFERIWDEAPEQLARKGYVASYLLPPIPMIDRTTGSIVQRQVYDDGRGMPVLYDHDEHGNTLQPFSITFEQARKHPGKLWSMDTYVATERVVSDLVQSDRHYSDAMAMRFMLPEIDPATGKRKDVEDVKDGAYLLPRHLWVLDPQGKILNPKNRANRPSSVVEDEIMDMVDESARKHLFIQRRVMRKLGSRPLPPRPGGYTDAEYGNIEVRNEDGVVRYKFKLDVRGRYVGVEGHAELITLSRESIHDKHWSAQAHHTSIEGIEFDRQFTGYLVQVNSPDKNNPLRFSRMVLKSDEEDQKKNQIPLMDDRIRLGGENLAAGLSRLRLRRMNKYMRVKIGRFARFKEMASTLPSMLLPDHRVHGALDMRQGVAVSMTESFAELEDENARSDFLIEDANTYKALDIQGRIYRRWFDGPIEGTFEDATSVKPLTNGDNFGKLHDLAITHNNSEGALHIRDTARPIMDKFETDNKLFEEKDGFARSLASGQARVQAQLNSNDAFDVLEGPGVDRDYPLIKDYVQILNADGPNPTGNLRDSVIGQMVRGRTRHYSKKVRGMFHLNFEQETDQVGVGTHTVVDELW